MGIIINTPGFFTTIQDIGRIGYQEFGVTVSGVMDKHSFSLANILVDNDPNEATLEVTIMGPQIEFTDDTIIAITGADLTPKVNNCDVSMYKALSINKGDVLSFAGAKSGCRTYIAFAGGLDIPLIMGSKSTNVKAKIGGHQGRKLEKNDQIAFASSKTNIPNLTTRSLNISTDIPEHNVLRVIMGPQDDYFTSNGIETFLSETYTVTNEFDRMGYRLEGAVIEHVNGGDIITDGIPFGAIQIPSHGKPIIMLADRQTTGGYSKIATVISTDLPKIAQSKTGDTISFKKISVEDAQKLYLAEIADLKHIREKLNAVTNKPINTVQAPNSTSLIPNGIVKKYMVVINGEQYDVECEEVL